ncbi:MAG: hypothetical protein V4686_00260 [Patescibacteria group bacterium]
MNSALVIISKINQNILNPIIIILFGVAMIYFLFGVLEYLWKSKSDPAAIQTGAKHMGWGLFGMFVMVSVFGFLQFIINTLPIDTTTKDNVNKVLPLN